MDVKNKSMAIGLWIVFLTIIVCFVCRHFNGIGTATVVPVNSTGLFFASAALCMFVYTIYCGIAAVIYRPAAVPDASALDPERHPGKLSDTQTHSAPPRPVAAALSGYGVSQSGADHQHLMAHQRIHRFEKQQKKKSTLLMICSLKNIDNSIKMVYFN